MRGEFGGKSEMDHQNSPRVARIQLKFPPRGADSDFALFYFEFPSKFPPRGADSAQI